MKRTVIAALAACTVALGLAPEAASAAQGIVIGPGGAGVYFYGGRNYCWYETGWKGPGWYWCGYRWRHGYGWGGAYGWRGWRYDRGPYWQHRRDHYRDRRDREEHWGHPPR